MSSIQSARPLGAIAILLSRTPAMILAAVPNGPSAAIEDTITTLKLKAVHAQAPPTLT